jgi:hypothetical protein
MHTQINRHILYILLIDAYLVELLENKIFYSMGQNRNSTNEKKKRKVNLIVLSCKQIFHVFFFPYTNNTIRIFWQNVHTKI